MKNPILISFLLLTAAVSGSTGAACAEESLSLLPEDFNGTWVLNPGQSEDLLVTLRELRGTSPGNRDGMRGETGGGRGRGRGMSGARGSGRGTGSGRGRSSAGKNGGEALQTQLQKRAQRLQAEYSRIEIFLEVPELNLTDGRDITQLFYTDGRKTNVWTERGELTASAELRDGTLQVRTRGGRMDSGRTRSFTLSQDARQLILTEERLLPGGKEPLRIRMVYDRAN